MGSWGREITLTIIFATRNGILQREFSGIRNYIKSGMRTAILTLRDR